MFTIADIYNIAIQVEKNGEKEYEKAAIKTSLPKLRELYTWMAQQEGLHANWFAQLMLEKPEQSKSQQELNTMGREMLQKIIRESHFPVEEKELEEITDPLDAVNFAILQEKETITLYQFIFSLVEDREVKTDLQKIVAEEEGHITILEKMRRDLGGDQ
ncbi:ferritin family protein [Desulforhopalus vacuolatus]|uniref:ferritin family protein n=1 Tax=Desulforhopalus vacuolatus TaxID=40414 RepID=UPI001964555A|nr:ferritin family protein [Desulforhopalus vacuolatus]MBM9519282.1 ferritin family protein [Desulforhopalus vacuolatus]